jgi:hypothetical protein
VLTPTPRRRARNPIIPLLAALIAASALTSVVALPAHAADDTTIGISARPGSPTGESDGRTRFSYQVDPGQEVSDNVVIVNTGAEQQHFTILGTDAFSAEDGTFGLLATEQQPVMVGSWVRFANDESRVEFDLAPGEGLVVPFRVVVPPQAPPGDHAGGIVASVLTTGGQVNVDRRVAVRLYTRVSGDLQPNLTISGIQAEHHGEWWDLLGGSVTMKYTVQNSGNVALAANATTEVTSWFGIAATPSSRSTVEEILPGYSRDIVVELAGIGQWGFLLPRVRLNPYVDDTVNTDLQLSVPATSRETTILVIPWLVAIALGVVLLIVLFVWWRRRRDAQRAIEWAAYTEAEARRRAEEEVAAAPASGGSRG